MTNITLFTKFLIALCLVLFVLLILLIMLARYLFLPTHPICQRAGYTENYMDCDCNGIIVERPVTIYVKATRCVGERVACYNATSITETHYDQYNNSLNVTSWESMWVPVRLNEMPCPTTS